MLFLEDKESSRMLLFSFKEHHLGCKSYPVCSSLTNQEYLQKIGSLPLLFKCLWVFKVNYLLGFLVPESFLKTMKEKLIYVSIYV
jgi:hypothetical protein